ncbi:hypothetical protein XaFJ1_GM002284 [Xanthomonas albilineans]|nr:hypothetical protein XaFJ1_GM002284 [Xanthomonas albilineans]
MMPFMKLMLTIKELLSSNKKSLKSSAWALYISY